MPIPSLLNRWRSRRYLKAGANAKWGRDLHVPPRLTAKKTANIAENGDRWWTSAAYCQRILILGGRSRTPADSRNEVFKTVCGALLRRPGWVRFPSIPARFPGNDSQDDSYSSGHLRTVADARKPIVLFAPRRVDPGGLNFGCRREGEETLRLENAPLVLWPTRRTGRDWRRCSSTDVF